MLPKDSIATSVVPPPMSTTIDPEASVTGKFAPIAAAIGSSIKKTLLAPAASADSWMARLSTAVAPEGTQTTTCGLNIELLTFFIKCLIISSATSKSAITPSAIGLIALIFPGVFPNIVLASSPTAKTWFLPLISVIATTEGSLRRIPFPFT